MAKKAAKSEVKQDGPYITAARFCDYCMEDKTDGSISAIRIVDRIEVMVPAAWTPTPEMNIPIRLNCLVAVRSGNARGDHTLRMVMHTPKKEKHELLKTILPLEGDEQGANIRLQAELNVRTEGL